MQKSKNEKMRLVVDANAWISALLTPRFQTRLMVVFDSSNHLMVSEQLFRELDCAIRKPHLAKRIERVNYEELIFLLKTDAELVDVHSTVEICRDPKDNFLLALAKDGDADYLIAGDADLTDLKEFGKTKIVTLTEFEAACRKREPQ